MKIAIIGATGYGGAELVRFLNHHPEVSIHSIHATSLHGEPLAGSYPHMQTIIEDKLEPVNIETMASEVDLVFTATPSGVASKLAPEFLDKGVKVIDLSGDFRIKDGRTYAKWYGIEPAGANYLDEALYGLAEWVDTKEYKDVRLVSNPGCYPTAVLLGLAPLIQNNLVQQSSIIIDAKTGVSGAGKGLSAATHYAETNENMKIYKVNEHQHTPEIEQMIGRWANQEEAITFSTHLVPMTRGIMATMYGTATQETSTADLVDLFQAAYADDYFVRVREAGSFPATKEVFGSNFCDIGVTYDERTNRITVVSVIDNLVKGASGQAIQNMNKLLGLDEKTGLNMMPVYP